MVVLVEWMLTSHKSLPRVRTAPDKTAIERQIAATDREDEILRRTQDDPRGRIDRLVYELC